MHQLVFTAFLNRLFGPLVLSFLQALHIYPQHPNRPISDSFAMELLVVLLLTIFFVAVRVRLSVESPGGSAAHDGALTDSSRTWPVRSFRINRQDMFLISPCWECSS